MAASPVGGFIQALYWSPSAGVSMHRADRLALEQGRGVTGDRYALGIGAYSEVEPDKDRHLTLITAEAIETASAWQQAAGRASFDAAQTRRNVVVDTMSAGALNDLIGRRFRIGAVLCEGVELATPCDRPSTLSGIAGFQEAFDGRGGIRARVLESGTVRVGDAIRVESPPGSV
jgi:MOSC domain-containing protein YiiM